MSEKEPLYPLRPSELVMHPERVSNEVEPLALSEADWEVISQLEEPLVERLEAVDNQHLEIYRHQYYPEYFDGEAGEQRFSLLYETSFVHGLVDAQCEKYGVELTAESERVTMYGAALKDVAKWEWPIEVGAKLSFPTLRSAIDDKITQEVATIEAEMPAIELHPDEQRERFYELELNEFVPEYLSAIQAVSSEVAQRDFETAFAASKGVVAKLADPERVMRVVNVRDLFTKMVEYRTLRDDIKQQERELVGNDPVSEAQRIVLALYREKVNGMIAQQYPNVQLLENDHSGIHDIDAVREQTALARQASSSSLIRVNSYLRGIGVGKKGHEAIPSRLAQYVETASDVVEKNEESERFNAYTINAEQMQQLLALLVDHYSVEDEHPWEVNVDQRVSAMNVDGKKHLVQIQPTYTNGIVNAIAVAEHEGSHVLQTINREHATDERMVLTRRFASARNAVLAEAGAMEAEREAKQQMVGTDRQALPYFYVGLRTKERGGTFKDCYRSMIEAYAERNGTTVEALCASPAFAEASKYVYSRALRLFKEESGLSNPSSGLTSTEQLSYVEQEMVVPVMKEHGLDSLVYLSGVDLYSLPQLQRLGVVDVDKIRKPDLFLAKQFWPFFKAQLALENKFEAAWEATITHFQAQVAQSKQKSV